MEVIRFMVIKIPSIVKDQAISIDGNAKIHEFSPLMDIFLYVYEHIPDNKSPHFPSLMKVEFIFIGKTTDSYLKEGIDIYKKRLVNYLPVEEQVLPASASRAKEQIVQQESDAILSRLQARDFVVLLDERGKEFTSREFAGYLQRCMNTGYNRLVMITGGAYGVSDAVREKAGLILSASRFTFTHQMIRLILVEQVYRAMTILRNESYHHD